jgi:hypothetical protein
LVQVGEKAAARDILTALVAQDPQDEEAWLWLSGAVESDAERRDCLLKVLEINPENHAARHGLLELDGLARWLRTPEDSAPLEAETPEEGAPASQPEATAAPVAAVQPAPRVRDLLQRIYLFMGFGVLLVLVCIAVEGAFLAASGGLFVLSNALQRDTQVVYADPALAVRIEKDRQATPAPRRATDTSPEAPTQAPTEPTALEPQATLAAPSPYPPPVDLPPTQTSLLPPTFPPVGTTPPGSTGSLGATASPGAGGTLASGLTPTGGLNLLTQTQSIGPITDTTTLEKYTADVTVERLALLPNQGAARPQAGSTFLVVYLTVRNNGPDPIRSLGGTYFAVRDVSGALHTDSLNATPGDCRLNSADLEASGEVSGCVGFEVPASGALDLVFSPYGFTALQPGKYLTFKLR